MKNFLIVTAVVCMIVLSALYLQEKSKVLPNLPVVSTKPEQPKVEVRDYKNIEYVIDGELISLVNGFSETDIPNSSAKTVIGYFGNELRKDLNDDGREDVVFMLTKESGGSGTFFYVVAALDMPNGFIGSQALYLGDRIAPQNIVSGKGKIVVVNYADRLPKDSFAVPPSIGKSINLLLDLSSMQFGEVVQNFEGEASEEVMSLEMKTWEWVKADLSSGLMTPKTENKFSVTFYEDGRFSATTDCNNLGGKYTTQDNKLTFGEMMMTMMYCDGSQEADFSRLLSETESYNFTSKGELILHLKSTGELVIFR